MKPALLMALLFVSFRLEAQSAPMATIPFVVEKNCIYFYCRVNATDSLKFLFDTGADGCVINVQSAGKLSLKIDGESLNIGSNGSNRVKLSSDNTLNLGGLVLPHIGFTLIPYEDAAFDGIVGTNVMRGHVIEIDYSKKELRFYEPAAYRNDRSEYHRCKLYFPENYLSIKGAIVVKGKKLSGFFGLDTGGDNLLEMTAPFSKKHALATNTVQAGTSTSLGSDGTPYSSPVVLIPEVQLGDLQLYRIFADLAIHAQGGLTESDKAGYYGNAFLKRFNIVLDIPAGYIYFKPNGNLYTPLYD